MEKKKQNIFLSCIVFIVAVNIVSILVFLAENFTVSILILATAACIEHVFVIYYVLSGYKKPHGNLLRYLMLAYAVTLGINLVAFPAFFSQLDLTLSVASLMLIPYIAGRLNKIKQNKVLIPLVFVLLTISEVAYIIDLKPQTILIYIRTFGQALEWFAISAAYFVRYKEHKEAGLTDAPKK